jgi:hypothetical protein
VSAPVWHTWEVFAPPAAPPRKPVAADSEQYQRTRTQIPRPVFLDDLQAGVVYDWLAGKAARKPVALDDDASFVNAARGFVPGADQAVAQILEVLDDDPHQRQLAAYLEHSYADLEAAVYPGITLYDSWYSGRQMDVPDVDAIPFAHAILKSTAFHSPIPANAHRAKLYQQIRDAALEHRKYRTLRQAAAAAFVGAEPSFDPVYRPLVDRFHYAWAEAHDDPAAIKTLLAKARDRKGLLEDLDKKVASEQAAFELRERHKRELQLVADWLRTLCTEALAKVKD